MNEDRGIEFNTTIETCSDRKVGEDSQSNGDWKQDEMSANTMQLLHQQSRTLEELNNTFLQNRGTLKSDLRSTGTSTSGYTDDDFLGSFPCPKYGLRDAHDEHRDPNLCENKPFDSFQIEHTQQSIELQEELAAEHFLIGHTNLKLAYEALNRQPKTVSSALDIVVQLQHNYHATLGRDVDYNTKQRSRRVTWKYENDEEENSNDQLPLQHNQRDVIFVAIKNHFKRDCPKRSRSPSPIRRSETGDDRERRPVYKIGRGQGLFNPIQGNKVDAIVETGADVTVLSRSFANVIGLSGTIGMKACLLNAENGKEMEADMNVIAKLQLGKTEIIWQVCIAPIRDDILIGMDLLKEVDGIIMVRQSDLLIKDELIPGRSRKETDYHISRVTVATETTLEPMAETDVIGKVDCANESVGVLDPASLQNGCHTGSVLMEMKEMPDYTECLPDYLGPILVSTGDNLTSHQKQEVARLLMKFKIIFAKNYEDLASSIK
ncbi:unnamed protein product [Mytilus coruscus]|uniref:Peptidase A2 domain-containing protein n=1 Tax=Mytilus coruscus TaxID=42192 RepID=A0A6J8BJ67_MYTCO|nr:unnamed protein product [Mytilus coruscus]